MGEVGIQPGERRRKETLEPYEQWIGHVVSTLFAELSLTSEDVVADLGRGSGRYAAAVAPRVKQVLAFDYAVAPIRVATARRTLSNVNYQVADITTLQPETLGGLQGVCHLQPLLP
jgi:2-polyprenyl-3-methyl-5-hydroxy-6-metoxy-1,4-benzoquinol methylase